MTVKAESEIENRQQLKDLANILLECAKNTLECTWLGSTAIYQRVLHLWSQQTQPAPSVSNWPPSLYLNQNWPCDVKGRNLYTDMKDFVL